MIKRSLTPSEYGEQCVVVQYMRLKHPNVTFFAIPNGGLRNKVTAAKLKAEGVRAGVPDLFIARQGRENMRTGFTRLWFGLFIEMKSDKGKPSNAQNIMIGNLRAEGYRVEVCYSADEAMKVIDEYLS